MLKSSIPAALAAGLSIASLSPSTRAAAPGGSLDDAEVNYKAPATERRGGFAIGSTTIASVVDIAGYPNDAAALGDPDRLEATGPSFGYGSIFWLGGTIRDFVTVGAGLATATPLTSDYQGGNFAFVLHVEGFPLYGLGRGFRDLGVALDGGPSVGVLLAKDAAAGDEPLAMGGGMSFVGVTTFYEPVRFWHFSFGPALSITHSFSQTMTANQFGLGVRFVFYGDQPEPSQGTARSGTRAAF